MSRVVLVPWIFSRLYRREKKRISYPSGRLASAAQLVVGGEDDENLRSHGWSGFERRGYKWCDDFIKLKAAQSRSVVDDGLSTSFFTCPTWTAWDRASYNHQHIASIGDNQGLSICKLRSTEVHPVPLEKNRVPRLSRRVLSP